MKITIVFVAVLLLPIMTLAENPDSRPSISLGLNGQSIYFADQSLEIPNMFDVDNLGYWVKFQFPSSDNVTFHVNYRFQNSKLDWWSTEKYRVVDIAIGFTFYIGESVNK